MRIITTFALLGGIVSTLVAQDDRKQSCSAYTVVPLPTEAQGITTPAKFPACESYKSYAGIGRPMNYEAARACAWQERAAQEADLPQNPQAPIAWVVGGSIILADLYANGLGTPRNLPLATRLACEQSEGFLEEGFDDLASRMKNQNKNDKPFELCEYAAVTFDMNFCESYQSQIGDSNRDRDIASLSSHWTEAQKAAFAAAKKSFDVYVETVGHDETYMGGTIRNLRAIGAMQEMQQDFFVSLRRYESGKLPQASAAVAQAHDAELNRVYQEALKNSASTVASAKKDDLSPEEEIQPEGIRKAERAWLAYRDAWVNFATLRYPSTHREAWLNELTETRIHRLLQDPYEE